MTDPRSEGRSVRFAETMLGRPLCPNCGSEYLIGKIRTSGSYMGRSSTEYYRCFRCFTKFTSADEAESETPEPRW